MTGPGSESIAMYPNPTSGQFAVEVSAREATTLRIEVADALGRVVYTDLSKMQSGLPETRLMQLPETFVSGVYLVRVTAGDDVSVHRLLLQKD